MSQGGPTLYRYGVDAVLTLARAGAVFAACHDSPFCLMTNLFDVRQVGKLMRLALAELNGQTSGTL